MHGCAQAPPNLALIKYWGNRNQALRLPSNGSISFNLSHFITQTCVVFAPNLPDDDLWIDVHAQAPPPHTLTAQDLLNPSHLRDIGYQQHPAALSRVRAVLDRVRSWAGLQLRACVVSQTNIPVGTGIASSAAAFAALALAAARAAGLQLALKDLSRLARLGSGSASRSVPDGFVEWLPGLEDHDSFAVSLFPPDHWPLVNWVTIVSTDHKTVGSSAGHQYAQTSPLQSARVIDAPRRLALCRQALAQRDFELLARVIEEDTLLMHAVMQTSTPPLLYCTPATVMLMHQVRSWRRQGWEVAFSIDAGPNVHILCTPAWADKVAKALKSLPDVQHVYRTHPTIGARWLECQ